MQMRAGLGFLVRIVSIVSHTVKAAKAAQRAENESKSFSQKDLR
jgi:hypothetical protein